MYNRSTQVQLMRIELLETVFYQAGVVSFRLGAIAEMKGSQHSSVHAHCEFDSLFASSLRQRLNLLFIHLSNSRADYA